MKKTLQQGVTLIELMVAVVVLAIIVSMALPSYQQLVAKSGVRSTGQSLLAALNEARVQAISQQRAITLQTSNATDNKKCSGKTGWDNGWHIEGSLNDEHRWQLSNCRVALTSTDAVSSVTFLKNGFVIDETSGDAHDDIRFCIEDDRVERFFQVITLRPNGLVSLRESTECSVEEEGENA
ncbi:MAG TPA: GspH/FimT family pseudopilin [Alcanivoracaceae bacterium]|nr:GspH/FimT family pseudopilin [Alcanivoracaceae bacterium]